MPKILVIDDDPQIRTLFKQVLSEDGMEVEDAACGKDGIALFAKGSFELVITDLFMPDIDGLTVISELRRDHPDVKIIGISGGPPQQQTKLLPLLGVALEHVRILKKPVDIDMLVSVVKSMLES